MLFLIENSLIYNQDLIYLWSPNFNVFTGIYITTKDLSPSLINIEFGMFLTKYKSTYSTVKDVKVLDILSISNLCFFWNNCMFEIFYRNSILQIV